MFQTFKNTKFKTKMVLVFVVVLCVNILIMSSLFYTYSSQDTIDNYKDSANNMLTQMNTHLDERFNNVIQKVVALSNDLSFTTPMKNFLYNEDKHIDPILLGEVANKITQVQMSDDVIYSIYLYTDKGIFDNYIFARNPDVAFEDTIMYRYFQDNPGRNMGWLPAIHNTVFIDDELVIPRVYKQQLGRHSIIYVVNISQQYLSNYLQNTYSFFESVFIIDQEGRNVVNFDETYEEVVESFEASDRSTKTETHEMMYKGKAYVATASYMKQTGYTIYAINPVADLTQHLRKAQGYILTGLCITGVVSWLVIVYLIRTLTKPLEELARTMNQNAGGKLSLSFTYDYDDEVGSLTKSYNNLMKRIEQLLIERSEKIQELQCEKELVTHVQAQKRKAELKALQAQINPHFLYNTLNTITWQAEDIDADEISILSNTLGKFFRLSLSKGREKIAIRDEMEHVKSYLIIQKIRYTTRLDYTMHVPQNLCQYETINLILQPLIENAIYHGVKEEKRTIAIGISGCLVEQGDSTHIQLVVEDNGVGIEPERLARLNKNLVNGCIDSDSGYGIYNVNERLRLAYGESYGLTLQSKVGIGTKAILLLPAINEQTEVSNV